MSNMTLKDFVHHTIVDIVDGVMNAREELTQKKSAARIAPSTFNGVVQNKVPSIEGDAQYLDFDIAVGVDEISNKGGGRAGLSIGATLSPTTTGE